VAVAREGLQRINAERGGCHGAEDGRPPAAATSEATTAAALVASKLGASTIPAASFDSDADRLAASDGAQRQMTGVAVAKPSSRSRTAKVRSIE
jgi:hypothetical protein